MARRRTNDRSPALGITLAQYAGVIAGLAEGFAIEDVLANERIEPAVWPRAEQAWMDRLDEDQAAEWVLDERFDAHLADAQERYGRRVPPLDEDLSQWLDFLRIWSASERPLEMLGELGLRTNDLTRLHRQWTRRFTDEPALQRAALSILDREPSRLPIPRPENSRLVPPPPGDPSAEIQPLPGALSDEDDDDQDEEQAAAAPPTSPPLRVALPWRRPTSAPVLPAVVAPAAEPPAPASTNEPPPPITFLEYASLRAELVVHPDRREITYAKYGLTSGAQRALVEDYWQSRFAADADECAEWQRAHDRMVRHWMQLDRRA